MNPAKRFWDWHKQLPIKRKILLWVGFLFVLGVIGSLVENASPERREARLLERLAMEGRDVCGELFDRILTYPETAAWKEEDVSYARWGEGYRFAYSGQVTAQTPLGLRKTVPYRCLLEWTEEGGFKPLELMLDYKLYNP